MNAGHNIPADAMPQDCGMNHETDLVHCPRCGLELVEKEHRPIAGRFEFVEYLECSCGYTEPK